MNTARDIIRTAVERTDVSVRGLFGKDKPFIRFASGRSITIEDEITNLSKSGRLNPFPLVAMFTEGVTEWRDNGMNWFRVPKIAIIIRTKVNTTESQKLNDSFNNVLHPIYNEFERQLARMYFGYGLVVEHYDLPCMTDKAGTVSLNQLCDAVIIRNLRFKYRVNECKSESYGKY